MATVFFNLAQYLLGLSVLFSRSGKRLSRSIDLRLGRKEIDKIFPSGRIFRAR